jgi:hypothetical protein
MPVPNDEVLKRFGMDLESAERLGEQAALAEQFLGIHGVSATARESSAPARRQKRSEVERVFQVHDTPSRRDSLHRTIELPKPVTREVTEQFNDLFRDGN